MTLHDKNNLLRQFRDSEAYDDLMALGREYYNIAFKEASRKELPKEQRISFLDYMEGLSVGLNLLNALNEAYENELKENQGEYDE